MTADHPTREERYAAVLADLVAHRKALGMTQQDVADRCEVSRPQLGNMERGRGFSVDALFDYAAAVGCRIALLAADPAPAQPDAALSDRIFRILHNAGDGGIWEHFDARNAQIVAETVAAGLATRADVALSDDERDALVRAIFEPDDDCAHNMVPLYAAVERILAARAAQPAPAPAAWLCVHGFGIHEAGRAHHDDDTPLFTQPVSAPEVVEPVTPGHPVDCGCDACCFPAPEVSRGVAEVKAEALREAADELRDEFKPVGVASWLRERAEHIRRTNTEPRLECECRSGPHGGFTRKGCR